LEIEDPCQVLELAEAGHALGLLARCEAGDGGDGHDAEGSRYARVGVDVHLALVLRGQLLELGRDLLARSAPLGPEIDDTGCSLLMTSASKVSPVAFLISGIGLRAPSGCARVRVEAAGLDG
jgi:hypothetical protein